MKKPTEPGAGTLKKVSVRDLDSQEFQELKEISRVFGDISIIESETNLQKLYDLSKTLRAGARQASDSRRADMLENFVLGAAAKRQLFYREHQAAEGRKKEISTAAKATTVEHIIAAKANREKGEEKQRKKKKPGEGGEQTSVFQ